MNDLAVLLACGCRANSLGRKAGEPESAQRPACAIHSCFEIAQRQPDLAGRMARCADFGKTTRSRNAGPIYGGGKCENGGSGCRCEVPSSLELPFFKYRGPGSPDAVQCCARCVYHEIAHAPLWSVALKIEREWYKVGRHTENMVRTGHAFAGTENEWAEAEADFFRRMTRDPNTQVYSVAVEGVVPARERHSLDHRFEPHGSFEVDEFYCGCYGWD